MISIKSIFSVVLVAALSVAPFAQAQNGNIVSRSQSAVNGMQRNGTQFFNANGQRLSTAQVMQARDLYMKDNNMPYYFRTRIVHQNGIARVAIGAYDRIGGTRVAARVLTLDTNRTAAQNALAVDQTAQSLAAQLQGLAQHSKEKRSIAEERQRLQLPFYGIVKLFCGLGFLWAAIDLFTGNLQGNARWRAVAQAAGTAVAYVILDNFFEEAD